MRPLARVAVAPLLASEAWVGQRDTPDPSARTIVRALEEVFTAIADRVTPSVVRVRALARKTPVGAREDPERFRAFFERPVAP